MRTLFIPLIFIFVFGGCAYFEQQRIAQLELDLAEYEANMRESQNALQGIYGDDFLSDFYAEAYEVAKEAKEMLREAKGKYN